MKFRGFLTFMTSQDYFNDSFSHHQFMAVKKWTVVMLSNTFP